MLSGFARRGGWWVVAQVGLFVAIALALTVPPFLEGTAGRAVSGLGVAAGLAGSVMALAGTTRLGRLLTPYPAPLETGHLIDHGVYRLVRHPIYGGVVLIAVGLALVRRSLPAVVLGLVLLWFFAAKSAHEERMLEAAYPEYPAYRSRVRWRLIPWII